MHTKGHQYLSVFPSMNAVWVWAVFYALCPIVGTEMFDRISSLTWGLGEAPIPATSLPAFTQNTTSVRFHGEDFPVLLCQRGVLGPAAVGPCQRLCVGQWLEPLTSPFIQPSAEPARGVSSSSLTARQLFLCHEGLSKDGPLKVCPSSISNTGLRQHHPLQPALKCLRVYLDMVWVKHKRTWFF